MRNFSAPCCAMHFITSGLYLPGDGALEVDHVCLQQNSNVASYQTPSSDDASDFQSHRGAGTRALHSFIVGEELQSNHGSSYNFNS